MSDEKAVDAGVMRLRRGLSVASHFEAFTLLELLVVISIMGLIAALAVPALKNLGKSNLQAGAARQMLDDVGRARQLAVSGHTTVYMIFVPTNFWCGTGGNSLVPAPSNGNQWWRGLTTAQQLVASNLCDRQLSGYTFVSLRSVGDQPGQGRAHYLDVWKSLPDGTFIAQQKFQPPAPYPTNFPYAGMQNPPYPVTGKNMTYWIYGFNLANNIPFPTQDSVVPANEGLRPTQFGIPYIAFNYLGQLTIDGLNVAPVDEYIPLADGSVSPMIDPNTKIAIMGQPATGTPTVAETPPGNSTNSMYHLIHIDRLSGRATLEYQRVQ